MNLDAHVYHRASVYAAGWRENQYVIWDMKQSGRPPVREYPRDSIGWCEMSIEFCRLEGIQLPVNPPDRGDKGIIEKMAPIPAKQRLDVAGASATNSIATVGGIVGIVGTLGSLIPFFGIFVGFPLGVLAIILSSVGLSRTGSAGTGRGMAVTGLVLGILTVVFKLIPGINLL